MIIGLTGPIGSGKSTVAEMLARRGAVVIDTDLIAREVVEPPSPVLDAIAREFGRSVLREDGSLDRAALARVVFNDEPKRKKLNELTHPAILKRVLALVAQQPATAIVVVVVPLLFESQFEKNCNAVIAVVAAPELRRQRLRRRDDLPPAEVQARLRAQLSDADYERRAAIVVRNEGSIAELQLAVDNVWQALVRG